MYRASIENRGDSSFVATTRHASFAMDTEGKAANPVDTVLAGLCGCVGHYVRDFFREQGIPLEGFTVSAEARATADQSRLHAISVFVDIGEARLEAAREPELLAFVERCKLHGTLKRACPIDVALRRGAGAAGSPERRASHG